MRRGDLLNYMSDFTVDCHTRLCRLLHCAALGHPWSTRHKTVLAKARNDNFMNVSSWPKARRPG